VFEAAVLEAVGLAALRGDRLVFRGLDFRLEQGQALILTGPNGAGKSTLLRMVAGLLKPAAGQMLWDGRDALEDLPRHAARVAYLGHQDAVKPGLTTIENLRFVQQLWGGDALAGLVAVGLGRLADVPARLLSAGQKRRLALARLMLKPAALWLLDEPTNGLDARSIEQFGLLLGNHLDTGGMIMAATHVPLPLPATRTLALG
jgi:heme exporter protein A